MVVMIWVIGWKFPPGSRVSLVSAPRQGCHVCDSLTHLELTEAIRLGRFKPYAGVSSPPVRQLLHWLLEPLNTPWITYLLFGNLSVPHLSALLPSHSLGTNRTQVSHLTPSNSPGLTPPPPRCFLHVSCK